MDDNIIISHMFGMGIIYYDKPALLSHNLRTHVMTCLVADIMIVHTIIILSPHTYHAARDTQSAITVDDETAQQLFQTCTSSKIKYTDSRVNIALAINNMPCRC